MDWTVEVPEIPGYYFIDYNYEEWIVEIFITFDGPKFFEFNNNNIVSCSDYNGAKWLGPIKSEDIINLWKFLKEENEEK